MKQNLSSSFIPQKYRDPQPNPITQGLPEGEKLELDVLFVGAGPASLAGALRLHQLQPELQIGILEKASRLGGHTLSGAVINPIAFQKLFPDIKKEEWPFRAPVKKEKMYFLAKKTHYRIPLPPTMKNKGFYTASLCEVVRWLGQKAEDKGINIFPNTAAQKLIINDNKVIGIQTTASGLDRNSEKTGQYQEPINILARYIFLADGVRGNLSQAWLKWKNISSDYPEHYALGIKEIWKVKKAPSEIIHTAGWPTKGFGGSFLYPLSQEHIAIGLVEGMDKSQSHWNPHKNFQILKTHPFFKKILDQGECLEWGAKAIPEGGFHSIPHKIADDNIFILGDAAHLVNVPSLKGVHYAMLSGITASEYLCENLLDSSVKKKNPQTSFSDELKNHPLIGKELYKVRNVVQILQTENKFLGFLKAGISILSQGRFPKKLNPQKLLQDSEKPRIISKNSLEKKKQTSELQKTHLPKADAVYLSGNKTRDDIPSHLQAPANLPPSVQNFYQSFCPAGVYEHKDGKLIIHAANCIDCKATDILGPWWSPREGGSGPDYNLM